MNTRHAKSLNRDASVDSRPQSRESEYPRILPRLLEILVILGAIGLIDVLESKETATILTALLTVALIFKRMYFG
jgi:hypothetical protein